MAEIESRGAYSAHGRLRRERPAFEHGEDWGHPEGAAQFEARGEAGCRESKPSVSCRRTRKLIAFKMDPFSSSLNVLFFSLYLSLLFMPSLMFSANHLFVY